MDLPRLSKSVRRITVFEPDKTTGANVPVLVFERRRRSKKSTTSFKPLERAVRMMADGLDETASAYRCRHKRSNRKRRDGWLRDLSLNVMKAERKGAKEINLGRMLSL